EHEGSDERRNAQALLPARTAGQLPDHKGLLTCVLAPSAVGVVHLDGEVLVPQVEDIEEKSLALSDSLRAIEHWIVASGQPRHVIRAAPLRDVTVEGFRAQCARVPERAHCLDFLGVGASQPASRGGDVVGDGVVKVLVWIEAWMALSVIRSRCDLEGVTLVE